MLIQALRGQEERTYVPAQTDPILEPWRWRVEEALEGLDVIAMHVADDGVHWFSTERGLVQYDGQQAIEIPVSEEALAAIDTRDPSVKGHHIMPDGSVLAQVGRGLLRWSDDSWEVIIRNVGISNRNVEFRTSADGTIWLMVAGSLWRLSADLVSKERVYASKRKAFLGSMDVSPDGTLWLCQRFHSDKVELLKLTFAAAAGSRAPLTVESYPLNTSTAAKAVCILSSSEGQIWYADNSPNAPLYLFDPRSESWTSVEVEGKGMRVFSLQSGLNGNIWAGAEGRLLRLSEGSLQGLYLRDSLDLPHVPLTAYELEGRLWIMGRSGYVFSVDTSRDTYLSLDQLHFLGEAPNGEQWFRHRRIHQGVVKYDPQTEQWRAFTMEDGLIRRVRNLTVSSHGLVWASGSHYREAAIAVYDGERWRRFLHPEFASTIEFGAMYESNDGKMWFGAGGGIQSSSSGGVLQYGVDANREPYFIAHIGPPVLPHPVAAFAESSDGSMIIGGTSLFRYDPESHFAEPLALGDGAQTIDMVYGNDGSLWVTKEHAGVFRIWPDGSYKSYTHADGLARVDATDLLLLADGSILAATGGGISRFDGQAWTAHALPPSLRVLGRHTGLFQGAQGDLWLNMAGAETNALSRESEEKPQFFSVRYSAETFPPDTQILRYVDAVAQPGNTIIEWSGRDQWSHTPKASLQYSWRLNGGPWSAYTKATSHAFLDLDDGKHLLEVRARDKAFNVDPTPAVVTFNVIPPIWKQPWFIAMIATFSGIIIALIQVIIRGREKNLLEQQKQREAFLLKEQADRENHLLEIDRIKTGFFTNISHELRTPLTVVAGRLNQIFKAESEPQKRGALSSVIRNVDRLSDLVTQLLDFRKIEEGQMAVNSTTGDVAKVVSECVENLNTLAESSDISMECWTPDTCTGNFDQDKLNKVFTNLVANSIKYTEPGGRVTVSLESLPEVIVFSVEDTGIGIPKEHQAQIFEKFYRVSEQSMSSGSGVGLNLTKELVELLNGTIHVESPIFPDPIRPGTLFRVEIPFESIEQAIVTSAEIEESVETHPGDPVSEENDEAPGSLPLVLICEDDLEIRRFVEEGLKAHFRVETAKNGKLGLEKAKSMVPDLVVTDVMMPEMSGVELCAALKQGIETSHIPLIMLTAKTSVENQMEGLQQGADDYVTKPFNMDLLQVRISNLLESRRLLREKYSQESVPMKPDLVKGSPEEAFLKKVSDAIDREFSDPKFNPDAFAKAMAMSRRTLHRKLKAVTDRTPSEYINQYRLAKAAERLLASSDTIADICYSVGYEEPTNFSRMFKAHYKVTPSKYRESSKCSS
ncbi:MAG: ATP-binding protein [Opitutales bacterium]